VRSIFASGLNNPLGLAFDSAGDLFEADYGSGNIYEYTPGGAQTTFASGLSNPAGLAFEGETLPVPEPAALGLLAVGAAAFLVRRHRWHP
jgi:glucose/arabinose dehydrogenase